MKDNNSNETEKNQIDMIRVMVSFVSCFLSHDHKNRIENIEYFHPKKGMHVFRYDFIEKPYPLSYLILDDNGDPVFGIDIDEDGILDETEGIKEGLI